MWISCRYPNRGGFLKFTVFRYGSKLQLDFQEGIPPNTEQHEIFERWLDINHDSSYTNLFNRLEALAISCNTTRQLISTMLLNQKKLK
jgi:hypothetical protein